MFLRSGLIMLCLVGGFPAAAWGQDVPTKEQPKDKKICKRSVATGSVMVKSICHTKAEWDRIAAQSVDTRSRALEAERSRSTVGISR